jgi:hypothetical protein
MLISMPTGTSTIFGVFQLIRVSPKQCWHDIRAGIKTRLASNVAQARKSRCRRHTGASDTGNFPLGQGHFALGQGERTTADRRMNNVGHGSRIRSACRSRLSQTETSVGMSESRPKRRHSGTVSSPRLQQSLSAVLLSALAPSACCAAVGSPCICRCVSCEDAATSPVF